MILARAYQILCPVADADDLRDALQELDPTQEGYFTLGTALGPEAAPGAGVSSTITHMLDGPLTAEPIYQAACVIVAAYPGAEVADQRVQILDGSTLRWCTPDGARGFEEAYPLFQHDETWEPMP